MPEVLAVNGVPVEDLGVTILSAGGVWSPPAVGRTYTGIPGLVGAVPLARAASVEKRVPVRIHLSTDVAGREAAREALQRLFRGLMRLQWSDAPGRHQWALLDTQAQQGLTDQSFVRGDLVIEAELVVPAAVSWSDQPTVLALPADTAVPTPLGTATSAPRILIPGPWTDLRIGYHRASGEELAALQLVGSISSDEVLEVDVALERLVLEDTTSGVRVSGSGLYGSGSFPVLDPHDALGSEPHALPYLLASADGLATYRRAWE